VATSINADGKWGGLCFWPQGRRAPSPLLIRKSAIL